MFYRDKHKTLKSFSDAIHTQESSDNVMFVRFYTNSRYPNNGLKAKVKIGVCGGTRYLGSKLDSVEIKSPDYPGHYR